jgi:hypothetical protein
MKNEIKSHQETQYFNLGKPLYPIKREKTTRVLVSETSLYGEYLQTLWVISYDMMNPSRRLTRGTNRRR